MELAVGAIAEGKVTGITNFGAFVALPGGKTGMVHISEVANTYVNNIRDHLTEGQEVKVKILAIDPAGKINLSIKKAIDPPPRSAGQPPRRQGSSAPRNNNSAAPREPQTFEDKLKAFMADSDSKLSSVRQYSEHKTRSRRR